jgi:PPP family 3-phenylpropionic acid transporter
VTPLAAFGAVSFTYFAAVGLFNPYAPLWFKELGFSTLAIGVLASVQSWTRVLAPYAWGWLADHSGRRIELLRVASLLAFVSSFGLLFVDTFNGVALFVLLLFMCNGGVVPLSEAALSAHLSTGQGMDTARYGRVRVWGSVGFIIAVTLYGVVLQWLGLRAFPWLVVSMLSLLVLAAWRLPLAREVTGSHGAPAAAAGVWAVLRQPVVAWFFAGVFFTVLAHTALYAFFSLYLDTLGYGKPVVGLMWAVSVAVEIAFFWTQGRWFRLLSAHGWVVAAAALSVLRFAGTAAFGHVVWVLVLAQTLHAVTFAAQHAACIVLVHRHFPGRLRGRGQALYTMLGYGVSGVLGGVLGGAISQRFGFAAVFWWAAGSAAVGVLCAVRAARLDVSNDAVSA